MTVQARRTQAERRNQSEQALLEAATALIATEGVGAVTFEALGKAGGFSRGLAGARFGSKAGLIEAVLRHAQAEQEALVGTHELEGLTGLEALLAHVDLCLRDISRSDVARAYFKLLSWSVAEAHETRDLFAAMHEAVKQQFQHWILKGQADGTIRPDIEAAQVSLVIGSLMLGLNMQAMVDEESGADALRQAVASTLRASLVPKEI
jgi:AcrR family transcriptional regulator